MEIYDEVWFWQLTTLALGVIGIVLMFRSKKQGEKDSSVEKYNQHLKSLVNSIHDGCQETPNGNKKPYYFDEIEKHSNKVYLIQHFFTLKESNVGMFDAYKELERILQKVKDKRNEQNQTTDTELQDKIGVALNKLEGQQTRLKDEFGVLFQSFYDKISTVIKSDFGACSECIDSVNDKKMRKKYAQLLK